MNEFVNEQSDALKKSNGSQTMSLSHCFVQIGQRHIELWLWNIFVAVTKFVKIGQTQTNKTMSQKVNEFVNEQSDALKKSNG